MLQRDPCVNVVSFHPSLIIQTGFDPARQPAALFAPKKMDEGPLRAEIYCESTDL